MIPYGRQTIDDDDIQAVIEVLKSDYLTTGPKIQEFEKAICEVTGAKYGVAISSGTAALHAAVFAAGLEPGDEVITTPITFAATSNVVLYQGATPVFADISPDSLLIDPKSVESFITTKTKAIIAVDYAGQPCDYGSLRKIARKYDLTLISDACHSIGAKYKGRKVGTLADMTCFSFHPVKHITTGEGGAIVTNSKELADKMRTFRNHGITTDHAQRMEKGSWFYEMLDLGFNYRITDIQCALGISQIKKLNGWIKKRNEIAKVYDAAFAENEKITPLKTDSGNFNSYHLYVVKLDESLDRAEIFSRLREQGIGVNVHYIPVYLHPYYQNNLDTAPGLCPKAEKCYEQMLSLPIFEGLTNVEQQMVIQSLEQLTS